MRNQPLWISVLIALTLSTGAYAQATEVANPPVKKTEKKTPKKVKPASGSNAKFVPGSQETKKERNTRLTRECKGEVNAGACTGYTR